MRKLINFLGFQVGWLASIWGAAEGLPWLGPLVVGAIVGAHLVFTSRRTSEAMLIGIAAACGYIADSILAAGGWLRFEAKGPLLSPSPLWMVALWPNFAATLRTSLGWLDGRYAAGAALGAVGGPLSYYAGAKLGAVSFPDLAAGLAAVAVEWAVATPLLLAVSRWTLGFYRAPRPGEARL